VNKPMRRLVFSLVAVAVVVVAVQIAFQFVTEQNRAAEVAQAGNPAAIDAYQALVARSDAQDSAAPPSQPEEQALNDFPALPDDSDAILDGYKRLFTHLETTVNILGPKQAFELENILLRTSPHKWTDEQRSKIAEFILANQDLVLEIREMSERGAPVHPLDFSKGFAMELPHLAPIRKCARVLAADAAIKAAQGNHAEAVEDILAGMKLGDALVQEPVLISQLVRIAHYGIMSSALVESFKHCRDLSAEHTQSLMTQIAQADNHQAFADALAGERYMGLQIFADVQTTGWWRTPNSLLAPSGSSLPTGIAGEALFAWLYASPLGKPWVNMDEEFYADTMNRVTSVAGLPYYQAVPELDAIAADLENLPRTRVLSATVLPSFSGICLAQALHEATLDLMQMGILLEQYQARNGSYPASLDAIAPDLGDILPVDPFTGEPYHYLPSVDSFLLYSVGRNLSDDGGRHDGSDGDWVWRGVEED
jgi:hypothetical protein